MENTKNSKNGTTQDLGKVLDENTTFDPIAPEMDVKQMALVNVDGKKDIALVVETVKNIKTIDQATSMLNELSKLGRTSWVTTAILLHKVLHKLSAADRVREIVKVENQLMLKRASIYNYLKAGKKFADGDYDEIPLTLNEFIKKGTSAVITEQIEVGIKIGQYKFEDGSEFFLYKGAVTIRGKESKRIVIFSTAVDGLTVGEVIKVQNMTTTKENGKDETSARYFIEGDHSEDTDETKANDLELTLKIVSLQSND